MQESFDSCIFLLIFIETNQRLMKRCLFLIFLNISANASSTNSAFSRALSSRMGIKTERDHILNLS